MAMQDARSKLRPYLDMEKAMNSQRAFWGSMTYTESPMSPYTVNEVSVVKVGRGESVKAINIGLLRFVTLLSHKKYHRYLTFFEATVKGL